jgi:hypothetical protein
MFHYGNVQIFSVLIIWDIVNIMMYISGFVEPSAYCVQNSIRSG